MYVSEWNPVSELWPSEENISDYGYCMEFVKSNGLEQKKDKHWTTSQPVARMCFYEWLEIKEKDGAILWRENDDLRLSEEAEFFETQFGIFRNHNHGEFTSWMEWEDPLKPADNKYGLYDCFPLSESAIEGNFCDMFDCGPYAFAVSNLMHMGLGSFSIIRIGRDLKPITMYDNSSNFTSRLEYIGRYRDADGYVLIASGYSSSGNEPYLFHGGNRKTYLFRTDSDGSCTVIRELDVCISSVNSMAVKDGCAWLGQNKMISCLNLVTGELKYYTNKNDEELEALGKMG